MEERCLEWVGEMALEVKVEEVDVVIQFSQGSVTSHRPLRKKYSGNALPLDEMTTTVISK